MCKYWIILETRNLRGKNISCSWNKLNSVGKHHVYTHTHAHTRCWIQFANILFRIFTSRYGSYLAKLSRCTRGDSLILLRSEHTRTRVPKDVRKKVHNSTIPKGQNPQSNITSRVDTLITGTVFSNEKEVCHTRDRCILQTCRWVKKEAICKGKPCASPFGESANTSKVNC